MIQKNNNPRVFIVLLWITVMINMIFADIFSLIVEIVQGKVIDIPLDVTTMMGIAALATNIPILMILLSWILPHKFNRWANFIAAPLTIVYIVGGGTWLPHYLIIGSIEIMLLIIIMITSYRWKLERAS